MCESPGVAWGAGLWSGLELTEHYSHIQLYFKFTDSYLGEPPYFEYYNSLLCNLGRWDWLLQKPVKLWKCYTMGFVWPIDDHAKNGRPEVV